MRRPLILLTLLPLPFSLSCRPSTVAPASAVAEVHGAAVSRADLAYKRGIEQAYGNKMLNDAGALVALVNDALKRELGRLCDVTATTEEIAALARHADESSKAPEILAKVKRVFGDDRPAYECLYLAPKIVNRKLRSWYSRNAEIHVRERAVIEKAYALVRAGKSLEEAARFCGLDSAPIEFGKTDGQIPEALRGYFPEGGQASNDPMASILRSLNVGEVYENIVEDDRAYRVIRLLEKHDGRYMVEAILAEKRPFDEWFREQAEEIPVQVYDDNLRRKIIAKYPHVWWVRRWLSEEENGDER